jgi:non-homologous end joining protein Ku
MLEAKLDGQEIAKPEPVPETPVVDLMEALKRSVEEVKGRKTTKAAASKKKAAPKSGSSSTRRQPARKSA